MSCVNRDRLSAARRSWNMSRIRGKDTSPELVVRSVLHRMGLRFRLHRKIEVGSAIKNSKLKVKNSGQGIAGKGIKNEKLKGKKAERRLRFVRPDIVLRKYKTAIFVHGW